MGWLGERIKFIRKYRHLSREELAKKLEFSLDHLNAMEANKVEPTDQELRMVAESLEVSVDHLSGKLSLDDLFPSVRISIPRQNLALFRKVFFYILDKVGGQPHVGKTVLCKYLYFIDFDYYETYEEQLMGLTYKKMNYGPLPVEFSDELKKMKQEHFIHKIEGKCGNFDQTKYILSPSVSPLRISLPDRARELIDDVLGRLKGKGARKISAYSHGDIPWKVTKDGEVISYELVFYRTPEYSVREDDDEDDD